MLEGDRTLEMPGQCHSARNTSRPGWGWPDMSSSVPGCCHGGSAGHCGFEAAQPVTQSPPLMGWGHIAALEPVSNSFNLAVIPLHSSQTSKAEEIQSQQSACPASLTASVHTQHHVRAASGCSSL